MFRKSFNKKQSQWKKEPVVELRCLPAMCLPSTFNFLHITNFLTSEAAEIYKDLDAMCDHFSHWPEDYPIWFGHAMQFKIIGLWFSTLIQRFWGPLFNQVHKLVCGLAIFGAPNNLLLSLTTKYCIRKCFGLLKDYVGLEISLITIALWVVWRYTISSLSDEKHVCPKSIFFRWATGFLKK